MKSFLKTEIRSTLVALAIVASSTTSIYAQQLDIAALTARAEAGEADAQRELGEALIYGTGGAVSDTQKGVSYLEQAATNGDVEAQAILGKLLVDGVFVAKDTERGLWILNAAATAGNLEAQTTLGLSLLWGLGVDADPEQARGHLAAAAEQGSTEAARTLGEALVYGQAVNQDVEAGVALLEKAVAAGDTKAKMTLGSAYFDGVVVAKNRDRATALFEEAAKDGEGQGLETVGTDLLWSKRDVQAAETYLRRAGELGRVSAWDTLAEGAMYGFLGKGSRAKFDGFAEKARATGSTRIEVLDAERQMWGISMRASGPKTIEKLEAAAKKGNVDAALFLVSLVRDGNQMNVRKRPADARTYLDEFATLLTQTEIEQLKYTIDAAETKQVPDYKALADRFAAYDASKRTEWFGQEIFDANPNLATYILQGDMKRTGTYNGAVNGTANASTLRAIWQECRALPGNSICGDSVMRSKVFGALLSR